MSFVIKQFMHLFDENYPLILMFTALLIDLLYAINKKRSANGENYSFLQIYGKPIATALVIVLCGIIYMIGKPI